MSIFPEKTIKDVLKKLKPKDVLNAINYRTDTIQEASDTIKSFCPIHQEQVFRTLIINNKDKSYRCSYSLCPGNKGGDLISLYAKAKKIDYDDGLSELVQLLNLPIELPTTQEFIDKTVEVAENYLELGVLDESENYFKKTISHQPQNLRSHLGLYEIYTRRNEEELLRQELKIVIDILIAERKFDEAINHIRTFLEKEPESLDLRRNLIECLTEVGNVDECYGEYMNLADLYEINGDYENAIEVYRKLEKLDIDIIDVYSHIINLLIASSKIPEAINEALKRVEKFRDARNFYTAIETLEPVLELDKSRNDLKHLYIDLCLELSIDEQSIDRCMKIVNSLVADDAPSEAIFALKRILNVAKDNVTIISKLAEVYQIQGNEQEAKSCLIQLADIFLKNGNTASSLSELDKILEIQSDYLPAMSRKADIYIKNKDKDKASETLNNIVEIYRKNAQPLDAVSYYQKMVDLDPDNLDLRAGQIALDIEADDIDSAYQRSLKLVDMYINRNEKDKAVERLRFALDLKPDETEIRVMLADLLSEIGKKDEAKIEYFITADEFKKMNKPSMAIAQVKKIIEFDPNDIQAVEILGSNYIELKDNLKAIQTFRDLYQILKGKNDLAHAENSLIKILQIQPEDLTTLNELVFLYKSLKNPQKLVQTYEKLVSIFQKKGAFGKVSEYCEEIIKTDPENISAHKALIKNFEATKKIDNAISYQLKLASIYQKLGNSDEQAKCYEYILKHKQQHTEAREKYVFLLYHLDKKQKAFAELELLIEQLIFEKKYDSSIAILNKILETEPDNPSIHLKLINVYQIANKIKEAISQTVSLINLYQKTEQFDEVVTHYRSLLRLEPENVVFRTNLIENLLKLELQDDAVEEYFILAKQYTIENNLHDAENIYHEILRLDNKREFAHESLINLYKKQSLFEKATQQSVAIAKIYEEKNNFDKAISALRNVFEYDKSNISIYKSLISIYKKTDNKSEAANCFAQIFDIYKQQNRIDDAVKIQHEAINFQPDNPELRRTLIDLLKQTSQNQEAVKELFNLADYYSQIQDFPDAVNIYSEIVQIDESNIKARKHKAEIYNKMGNVQAALEEFMSLSNILEKGGAVIQAEAPQKESRVIQALPICKEYTFESFVVGARNNFAHATALAVAKAPATGYNPLFLYSDVGLGKTHLMHAIANYVIEHHSTLNILYTNTEEFTTELVNAIQNNTITQFRNKHKSTDVLLLDDVQFLSGKERAQEEFFHIFNTLFQAQKQIVITSDRPPKDIAHLEKRLRSRFGAGVIVDIKSPDLETRIAILKRELGEYDYLNIPNSVVNIIAEKMETNIRELKGALNQVIAVNQITGEKISDEMVIRVINNLYEKV